MPFDHCRRLLLASIAGGFICASAGTILFAKQAKPGERVNIVLTTVKAGKQQQFEDYMAKFGAAVEKAQQKDSTTKKVATQTRTLHPAKPNADGTFTYVFLMDPFIPDPNAYNMAEILTKVLSQAEVEKLMKQFDDAVVGPQQVLELVQK